MVGISQTSILSPLGFKGEVQGWAQISVPLSLSLGALSSRWLRDFLSKPEQETQGHQQRGQRTPSSTQTLVMTYAGHTVVLVLGVQA